MILPFKPIAPYRIKDVKRGMIYQMDHAAQFQAYDAHRDEYNLNVYGTKDISQDEIDSIGMINFIQYVEAMFIDQMELVPYYNYLWAQESANPDELNKRISTYLSEENLSYCMNMIGKADELKNAWEADVLRHSEFYRTLFSGNIPG